MIPRDDLVICRYRSAEEITLFKRQENILDLRVSHAALSSTRIVLFTVQCLEILQIYRWRHTVVFAEHQEHMEPILLAGMLISLMLAAGLFTRWMAFINIFLFNYIQWMVEDHYHLDNVLESMAFVFLLVPKPRSLALDTWIFQKERPKPDELVPPWFVALMIMAVSLLYLDSVLLKLEQDLWLKGLAFWLPVAIPNTSLNTLPDWLEIVWLMKIPSHTALVFEILYPLIIFKRLRWLFVFLGMSLHIGIILFLPIPLFGTGMLSLYFMFLPLHRLLTKAGEKNPVYIKQPEDKVMKPLVAFLCVSMFLSQSLLIVMPYLSWNKRAAEVFGLSRHTLFLDWHFTLKSPILRFETEVDGETIRLPSFDDKAYTQVKGRMWAFHNFYIRGDRTTVRWLDRNLLRFLEGWFAKHDLEPRTVRLYYKDAAVPMAFDFRSDEIVEARPWVLGGEIHFPEGSKPVMEWTPEFIAKRRDASAILEE
jgi:hypothetical protein